MNIDNLLEIVYRRILFKQENNQWIRKFAEMIKKCSRLNEKLIEKVKNMQRPIKDFLSIFKFVSSEICLELKRD